MESQIVCPIRYYLKNDLCYHYLWPMDMSEFFGTLFLISVTVLSSISGLGGGGIIIPSLMIFFNYLPKDSIIVVFTCILGTTLGNISNLLQDSVKGKPLINHEIIFISMPIICSGAIVGVIFNKFLPGITIVFVLVGIFITTIKKIAQRFLTQYAKQTKQIQQNIDPFVNQQHKRINPFANSRTLYIFKNLAFLVFIVLLFSFLRGSEKFPSLIGVQPCSNTYWFIVFLSFFIIVFYAKRNLAIAKTWYAPQQLLGQEITQSQNQIEQNKKTIMISSFGAGLMSSFGLGGGIVLVPMYRTIGATSLAGAGSVSFGVFLTALINTIQGVSIGVIQTSQLIYFTGILGCSTYFLSKLLAQYLRKKNRMSLITGFFIIFVTFGTIAIPISIFQKYKQSGYNNDILFSFGSPC